MNINTLPSFTYNLNINTIRTAKSNSGKKQASAVNSFDNLSFTGIAIKDAKTRSEVAKLTKLFFVSIESNLPQPEGIFGKLLEKLICKIASIPILHEVNVENQITKVAYQNKKIVGGFCFKINPENNTGHINFLTLSNELKHTKSGMDCLLQMANNIGQIARKNKLNAITWYTHSANKLALKSFKHLDPEIIKYNDNSSQYEAFKISTDKFIDKINKISENYKKKAE